MPGEQASATTGVDDFGVDGGGHHRRWRSAMAGLLKWVVVTESDSPWFFRVSGCGNRGCRMLVPNRLLFRFEFPLRYRSSPKIDGDVSKWTDLYLLPDLVRLDNQEPFGRLWMAWNESGLFIACRVEGRHGAFRCDPRQFWKGDNLRLCTDMRDTRDIKRASRYCQQFYFLPAGGVPDGRAPIAGAAKVPRAAEHAPAVPNSLIRVAGHRSGPVYTLEGHIPGEALSGFDPDEHRRIGVYVMLEDLELGQQYLTVGDDLNWHIDPSTWATAVLTGD